jgi:hypothetical protein
MDSHAVFAKEGVSRRTFYELDEGVRADSAAVYGAEGLKFDS